MKRYVILCLIILLVPAIFSSSVQAMSLERYKVTETLYPRDMNFNGSEYPSWALDWSPNGTYLAASRLNDSNDSMMVWNMEHREVVFSYNKPFYQVSFSPDGKYLAAAGGINKNLTVFDAHNWSAIYENYTDQKGTVSVSWSPDGRYLASGGEDGTVKIMDAKTWNLIADFVASKKYGLTLSWSPDGSYLATGVECGTHFGADNITIWETEGWSRIKTLYIDDYEFLTARVYAFTWTADSSTLMAGMGGVTVHNPSNYYPLIYTWSTDNWKEKTHSVISYEKNRVVSSLSYNDDSGELAVGISGIKYDYAPSPQTAEVLILNAENLNVMEEVVAYPTMKRGTITFTAAFSPDGKQLATAGPELAIYEKRSDYSPLYPYIIAAAAVIIVALLYMKRRRKNAPDVKLEEREAEDPHTVEVFLTTTCSQTACTSGQGPTVLPRFCWLSVFPGGGATAPSPQGP